MRVDESEYTQIIAPTPKRSRAKATVHSETLPEDDTVYTYFNKAGVECGESEGVAKYNNHGLYWIKYSVEGRERGMAFNPYSIYFREGDDTRRREMYQYKPVKPEGFNLYLEFLKTRNSSYRLRLERGHYEI